MACQAGGAQPDCNDGNRCTLDSCTAALGCTHADSSGTCDDGNKCTLFAKCAGGACKPAQPQLDCNDNNPCSIDACVPATGAGGNLCFVVEAPPKPGCVSLAAKHCGLVCE